MSVSNKICLITNASTSFAYNVARHLGMAGAKVVVADADERKLQYVMDGLKGADVPTSNVHGIYGDLSVEKGRTDFFEQVKSKIGGSLDALILTNSPNPMRGHLMESTQEDLNRAYDQYVHQPFMTVKHAIPFFSQSKNASILFISTLAAYTPYLDIGLYSAVQSGVIGLSRAMAQDLASKQPAIRVNTLALGMFEDDGASAVWSGCSGIPRYADAAESEQVRQTLSSAIPIGRLGKAEDAVGLIELLISDKSNYLTGEVFSIAGGLSFRF